MGIKVYKLILNCQIVRVPSESLRARGDSTSSQLCTIKNHKNKVILAKFYICNYNIVTNAKGDGKKHRSMAALILFICSHSHDSAGR